MKEWFKARNVWGAGIFSLTDEEAGRFVKALWKYTMTGETVELSGAEKSIMAIAMMTLTADEEAANALSATRAAAGSKGGLQKVANLANATFVTPIIANDSNCFNKNKNKNIEKDKEKDKDKDKESKQQKRFTPPTTAEVVDYCKERGNAVDPERFVDFYESKGWRVGNQPMKDWKAAVRNWERREGDNKGKGVEAQAYTQRDYTDKDRRMQDIFDRVTEGLA